MIGIVAVTGIPHGAIDHIIVEGRQKSRYFRFISFYVLIALVIVLLWIIATPLAFIAFILISGYHFGQSQLSHFSTTLPRWQRATLFMSWGLFVLLILFAEQWSYASEILVGVLPSAILESPNTTNLTSALGHFSGGIFLFTMLLAVIDRNIRWRQFLIEFAGLVSLIILFRTTDLYLAFAIFFGVWHSLRVMKDEYRFIKEFFKKMTIARFIRMLAPFSIISFAGILMMIVLKDLLNLDFSIIMLALILISALTLPHAISMEYMYNKINYQNRA